MGPIVTLLGLACLASSVLAQSGLRVQYQWEYVDWVEPSVEQTGKSYILGNSFPLDIDIDKLGRIFVTSPQWFEGIPISLSLMTNAQGPGGPLLTPYPDWSWHVPNDCEKITSVFRIAIDECDRLWFVDLGRRGKTLMCPMKIMVFDLNTDQLIHTHILSDETSLNGMASYVTPIVEIGATCLDTHLFVADVIRHGMMVYDLRRDHSWRLNNTYGNAFGNDSDVSSLTIAGETFDLIDGTLGMSLSPPGFSDKRYLYFNSLASYYQKFTDVDSLKMSENQEPIIYQSILKRPSQAGVQATSKRGVLFFQLVEYTAIACWNIEKPFTPENIAVIAQDEEKLQYVSGIKVKVNPEGQEELWFNTIRLQKIVLKTIRHDEVNYRTLRGLVDDLIRNTVCEPPNWRGSYPDLTSWRQI
ncbi:major royal jelly protein 1-like [Venturia canescens]|uniref:major royal jelly protein 1-like n=1 Tax=Venturia canescens TaxID=32260 RepID=UPI001C9BE4FC|nr:major royal jelly protein 1-like [Venturia canescens]